LAHIEKNTTPHQEKTASPLKIKVKIQKYTSIAIELFCFSAKIEQNSEWFWRLSQSPSARNRCELRHPIAYETRKSHFNESPRNQELPAAAGEARAAGGETTSPIECNRLAQVPANPSAALAISVRALNW
jgi:hypothetical protein